MRLSGVNVLLGLWLMISPLVLALHQRTEAWNTMVGGFLVFSFALVRVSSIEDEPFWSWCNTLLGLWLVVSPLLLGFVHPAIGMLNSVLAGSLIGLLAYASAHMTALCSLHNPIHYPALVTSGQ